MLPWLQSDLVQFGQPMGCKKIGGVQSAETDQGGRCLLTHLVRATSSWAMTGFCMASLVALRAALGVK